ncbi:MAG TPA: type II toxin-antitoxin system VapC family toxin [Gemmatimonadales bacterium]
MHVVAIAMAESDADRLLDAVGRAPHVGIGGPTLVEAAIVLSAPLRRDARALLSRFILGR